MPLSWRFSTLAERHRALGSKLEDWNGMGTAWTYAKDIYAEHAAIRGYRQRLDGEPTHCVAFRMPSGPAIRGTSTQHTAGLGSHRG